MKLPNINMTPKRWGVAAAVSVLAVGLGTGMHSGGGTTAPQGIVVAKELAAASNKKPVMAVTVTELKEATTPLVIKASGSLHAWHNAVIGAEIGNFQVKDVLVNVGDKVQAGQTLALLLNDTVKMEVQQQEANLAEARAALAEARANAIRTRTLAKADAVSEQELLQANTKEASMVARLQAAEAALSYQKLRLEKTRIVAPHSGTISSRTVTVGQVVAPGTELFRYIQGDRVEWQAELSAEKLMQVKEGQKAVLEMPNRSQLTGVVRQISPTLNESTRSGIAYVRLPVDARAKPGMFVSGEIQMGTRTATVAPGGAVVSRMGASFLMTLEGGDTVKAVRVNTGAVSAEGVEILTELPEGTKVIVKGAALLHDGDTVNVVEE